MKFVSSVVALVAMLAAGSEAAKPNNKKVTKRILNQRMRKGQFDKATIMENAKPHNENAKKRALEEEFQITSNYGVQFKSCFSLTTSYDDMFEGDDDGALVMQLFSQGNIMALQSYAIFSLSYGGGYGALEYVVDLSTYVQALVNYLPEQMENFCEACQENSDSCMSQLYGNNNNQYEGQYNNNNQYQQGQNGGDVNYNGNNNANYGYGNNGNGYNRKLSDIEHFEHRVLGNNQIVRELDCNLCQQYNCLDDDNNNQNNNQNNDGNDYESASEWISGIAECYETGVAYSGGYGYGNNNQQGGDNDGGLFAGMICNGDGTGIEIGLFYDEDCKLYLPNEAYTSYMSYFDQTYQEMTKDIIEFTFSENIISCMESQYIYTVSNNGNYQNQQEGQNYNYNQYNQYQEQNEEDNIGEWCEGLVDGETTPVDMNSCGVYNYDYNEDQNQNQNGQDQYQYTYDWYSYEITDENSEDMTEVCQTVQSSGDLHTFYNNNNGNLYSYGSTDEFSDFVEDNNKLSGGAIFGIISLLGITIGAVTALFLRFRAAGKDEKNVGLIDPDEVETKGGVEA